MSNKPLYFKPRARILLQLGDELIRNESVALLELIKNSYDACASKVTLSMFSVDDTKKGTIVVKDDGIGMDRNIIENVWMEPGSEHKRELLHDVNFRKKCGRTVLGEKGLGRFAAHKLGDEIELISRKGRSKEVYLKIDWTVFKKKTYLSNVPIKITERKPQIFTGNKTGTKIVIKKFRSSWTRAMLRDVYRSFNSLRSPFDSPEAFEIEFETDKKEWIEDLPTWKDVKQSALFEFKCEMEGNTVTKFLYKFVPWPNMAKLRARTVTEKQQFGKHMMMKKKGKDIDLSKYKIGKVKFEGFIFDRDPKILDYGLQDKKSVTEYLNQNGGIKVFRDGIRIYDYGEPGNDWLNLDLRRVNVPAVRISNNILIAAVSLERESSSDLKEKTNREGFIENDAYNELKEATLYSLGLVEHLRRADKNKVRQLYGGAPKSEPVISQITKARHTIEKKIKDKELKDELVSYMKNIERDYKTIHETLLRGAGAGLTLGVAVHEIEKIVEELNHLVKSKKFVKRIPELIKHLSELVEGYTLIIRKSSKQVWKVWDIVDQAIFNFNMRFKVHAIEIIRGNVTKTKNEKIACSRSHVVGCLMNIFDNSIWWLDYSNTQNKKIFVAVYTDLRATTTILVADNGTGFALPKDELTDPFVSAKPDGMGLGLHIVKEIMSVHKGKLSFPDWGDYDVPKDFRHGAIVALTFPREIEK